MLLHKESCFRSQEAMAILGIIAINCTFLLHCDYTAPPSCAIMKFMHMHHTGFITSCLESLLDSVLFPDQHRRKIKQERPPGHRCCQCQLCHHGKMIVRQRCCQSRVPALKGSSACLPMTSYYLPRSRTKIYEGL